MHLVSQQVIKEKLEKQNRFQTPGLHCLPDAISASHHSCDVPTEYPHYTHGSVPEHTPME